jgi:hypothetical protein
VWRELSRETVRVEALEVVVVLHEGQRVGRRRHRGCHGRDALAVNRAETQPWTRCGRLGLQERFHQLTEDRLGFPPDDDVDPGEAAKQRLSHGSVAVRAAKRDSHAGELTLDEQRRDQRSHCLAEGRREPYNDGLRADDVFDRPLQKGWHRLSHRGRDGQERRILAGGFEEAEVVAVG